MSSSLIGGKTPVFPRPSSAEFRCVSVWQLVALPERLAMEVTCSILSLLVISTCVFVSFNCQALGGSPCVGDKFFGRHTGERRSMRCWNQRFRS